MESSAAKAEIRDLEKLCGNVDHELQQWNSVIRDVDYKPAGSKNAFPLFDKQGREADDEKSAAVSNNEKSSLVDQGNDGHKADNEKLGGSKKTSADAASHLAEMDVDLIHDDSEPQEISKSLLSTIRCLVEKRRHQHKIAGHYYASRHNIYIFLPTEILAIVMSVLGFFVSSYNADSTVNLAKPMGLTMGILGSFTVFLQAYAKYLNYEGKASMHQSCAIQLESIMQTLLQITMADTTYPGMFDRSNQPTLHVTKREMNMLRKAESDFTTAVASCRALIPDKIECAFLKVESEVVLILSPVGTKGSLLDNDSSHLLLEYCYAELSIILTESIRFPKFMLPSPRHAATRTLDLVRERVKMTAELNLSEQFPDSTKVKRLSHVMDESVNFFSREKSWLSEIFTGKHKKMETV